MRHVVWSTNLAVCPLVLALHALGQTAAHPAFEAASIKPNPNCAGGRGGNASPERGRLQVTCLPVRELIEASYGMFADGVSQNPQRIQILGGPGWLDTDTFDITAKAPDSAAVAQMYGPMLQALLEDRFHLRIHEENKELPVYSLTVAKNGPKLQPTKEGSCTHLDLNHPQPPQAGQSICGAGSIHGNDKEMQIDVRGATMDMLSGRFLAGQLDRPVINKTGLTGYFEIHLKFSNDSAASAASDSNSPSIFTAIQDQLGLKITPDKGPVEVLVIDHIEKPTEN